MVVKITFNIYDPTNESDHMLLIHLHTYIDMYYRARWSIMKGNAVIGSLRGPSFVIRNFAKKIKVPLTTNFTKLFCFVLFWFFSFFF